MMLGSEGPPETNEDRFSLPLIITIVCMASFLLLVAALYGCCHQRISQRKDQVGVFLLKTGSNQSSGNSPSILPHSEWAWTLLTGSCPHSCPHCKVSLSQTVKTPCGGQSRNTGFKG